MKLHTKSQEASILKEIDSMQDQGLYGELFCERSDGVNWDQPNAIHADLKTYVSTLVSGASSATFPIAITHMSLSASGTVAVQTTTNSSSGSNFWGTSTFNGALTSIASGSLGRNFDTVATLFATTGFSMSLGASDSIVITWKITTG